MKVTYVNAINNYAYLSIIVAITANMVLTHIMNPQLLPQN